MFWQCFQGEAVFPSSLVLSLPLLTFYDLARLMPSVPVKVVSVRGGEKCAGASPRDPSRRPGERPAIAANPTRMIRVGARPGRRHTAAAGWFVAGRKGYAGKGYQSDSDDPSGRGPAAATPPGHYVQAGARQAVRLRSAAAVRLRDIQEETSRLAAIFTKKRVVFSAIFTSESFCSVWARQAVRLRSSPTRTPSRSALLRAPRRPAAHGATATGSRPPPAPNHVEAQTPARFLLSVRVWRLRVACA